MNNVMQKSIYKTNRLVEPIASNPTKKIDYLEILTDVYGYVNLTKQKLVSRRTHVYMFCVFRKMYNDIT